jgi:hypothetical protein
MSKRIVLSILMAMVLTLTFGCSRAKKAGTDAVDGTLGALVDGTQSTIEREEAQAHQRVLKRLGALDLKVSRWSQLDTTSAHTPGKQIELVVLVTNRSDKLVDLAEVVEQNMLVLLDTDGVSNLGVQIKGDSLIPPKNTIRVTLTVPMLEGTPAFLRVEGNPPVALPAPAPAVDKGK